VDTRVDIPVALVRELVSRARLAPSTRNTQPWSWTVLTCPQDPALACAVELNRVLERGLPRSDPAGRELVISCGAALVTLRVAAAEQLIDTAVEILPDPGREDVLARVLFVEGSVDAAFSGLDAAVPVRHTWRREFTARKVPAALLSRLAAEAAAEGAQLELLDPEVVPVLSALVRTADQQLNTDPRRRAELARWLRPRWRGDGIPIATLGVLPARSAMRQGIVGRRVAARDAALLLDAPAVAVLRTSQEDLPGWLAAGQALQRLLLVAAAQGVAAGFANGPCQDARCRGALQALLGGTGHPQIVLRLGYPSNAARPVPRRPLDELLVWPGSGLEAAARSARSGRDRPAADPGGDAGEDQLG
jgi:nitroreductase